MQSTFHWQLDRQVLNWTIAGQMKAVQLGQAVDSLQRELKKGATIVHVLLNVEEPQHNDNTILLFSTIIMPLLFDKRMGWLFMYGAGNSLKQQLKSQQALMSNTHWRVVSNRDEAIQKLKEKEPSLTVQVTV